MPPTGHPPTSPPAVPAGASGATTHLREDLINPDPLLDCLVEVCRLHGQAASRASLSAGLPLGKDSKTESGKGLLTLELAERAAARAGMSAKLQRLPIHRINTAALPAILILKGNHACVLMGWEGGGEIARVLLPETAQGSINLGRGELEARYTGVVLFVRPHFRFDARTPEVRSVKAKHWFWSALLEQRFVYRDVLWAALLINFFALAFPMFSMNVYDRVVPNNATETLWALSIGVVLIMCADVFMRLLRSHFVDEASARIDVQISATLMEKVLGMKLENRPESVGSLPPTCAASSRCATSSPPAPSRH